MDCPYTFTQMYANYPQSERGLLFKHLGWKDLIDNQAYANTCAIRMSVCLIRCGLTFPKGDLLISNPKDKLLDGKRVMIRFSELSDYLLKAWGPPERYHPIREADVAGRQGVIVYYTLPGGYPGHIDVVKVTASKAFKNGKPTFTYSIVSGHGDYFGSQAGRFWPAK